MNYFQVIVITGMISPTFLPKVYTLQPLEHGRLSSALPASWGIPLFVIGLVFSLAFALSNMIRTSTTRSTITQITENTSQSVVLSNPPPSRVTVTPSVHSTYSAALPRERPPTCRDRCCATFCCRYPADDGSLKTVPSVVNDDEYELVVEKLMLFDVPLAVFALPDDVLDNRESLYIMSKEDTVPPPAKQSHSTFESSYFATIPQPRSSSLVPGSVDRQSTSTYFDTVSRTRKPEPTDDIGMRPLESDIYSFYSTSTAGPYSQDDIQSTSNYFNIVPQNAIPPDGIQPTDSKPIAGQPSNTSTYFDIVPNNMMSQNTIPPDGIQPTLSKPIVSPLSHTSTYFDIVPNNMTSQNAIPPDGIQPTLSEPIVSPLSHTSTYFDIVPNNMTSQNSNLPGGSGFKPTHSETTPNCPSDIKNNTQSVTSYYAAVSKSSIKPHVQPVVLPATFSYPTTPTKRDPQRYRCRHAIPSRLLEDSDEAVRTTQQPQSISHYNTATQEPTSRQDPREESTSVGIKPANTTFQSYFTAVAPQMPLEDYSQSGNIGKMKKKSILSMKSTPYQGKKDTVSFDGGPDLTLGSKDSSLYFVTGPTAYGPQETDQISLDEIAINDFVPVKWNNTNTESKTIKEVTQRSLQGAIPRSKYTPSTARVHAKRATPSYTAVATELPLTASMSVHESRLSKEIGCANLDDSLIKPNNVPIQESVLSKEIGCDNLDKTSKVSVQASGISKELGCVSLGDNMSKPGTVPVRESDISNEIGCGNLDDSVSKPNKVPIQENGVSNELGCENLDVPTLKKKVVMNIEQMVKSEEISSQLYPDDDDNESIILSAKSKSGDGKLSSPSGNSEKLEQLHNYDNENSWKTNETSAYSALVTSQIATNQTASSPRGSENHEVESCFYDSMTSIMSPVELGKSSSVIDTSLFEPEERPGTSKLHSPKSKSGRTLSASLADSPNAVHSVDFNPTIPNSSDSTLLNMDANREESDPSAKTTGESRTSRVYFNLPDTGDSCPLLPMEDSRELATLERPKSETDQPAKGATLRWKIIIKHRPENMERRANSTMIEPMNIEEIDPPNSLPREESGDEENNEQ